VYAAADEQVARERARRRVVDHLVNLELVVARAGLEEEVVREVLDQVARGEDVVAIPGLAVGVLAQRALAAGDEVLRVALALDVGERTGRRLTGANRVNPSVRLGSRSSYPTPQPKGGPDALGRDHPA
jgi:hypothetical protein